MSAEDSRVGVGSLYEPLRHAARELVPLFVPLNANAQARWGASLVDVEPVDGQHRVSVIYPWASRWAKAANSIVTMADLEEVRATAITLLAYCEAQEDRHA